MTKPHTISTTCRVCGLVFPATRLDAITCTDVCRQRLRRGGAYAYFAGLSPKQQRLARAMHEAVDQHIAATREARRAREAMRAIDRKRKAEAAEKERTRWLAEMLGREMLTKMAAEAADGNTAEERKRRQKTRGAVASAIKLFTQEGREISAAAIAAFYDGSGRSIEELATALEELRASGDFDQIVATARKQPDDPL